MSHMLYELDVRLQQIEPPIWRTVEVPGAWSLDQVHLALQIAMGWTNSHLHGFTIAGTHYSLPDRDGANTPNCVDERGRGLQDLVKAGGSFTYDYDFGDGWEHDVVVTKVTTVTKPPRPRCVAGARACPPEDCGGAGGYEHMLAVLADPKHEEHDSMVAWSEHFDPERFALPKGGVDLRDAIEELEAAGEDDEDVEGPLVDLPPLLLDAVLALDPLRRASLAAIIAGSLADELMDVRRVTEQLIVAMKEDVKKPRAPRKRARS